MKKKMSIPVMLIVVLRGYDTSTKQIFIVTPNDVDSMSIQLSRDHVVWKDMMNMDLRGYNLLSKEEFIITPNDVDSMSLQIGGEYVVWMDMMDMDLRGYNLLSKEEFIIAPNNVDSMSIQIGGDYVVWMDMTNMGLRGYNLLSQEEFIIAPNDVDSMSIQIGGDYVVWKNMMNVDLRGYNLLSKEEFIISLDDVDSMSIQMGGEYVVWKGAGAMYMGLRGYDLSMKQSFIITSNDVDSMNTLMGGNYVFWREMSNQTFFGARIYSIINDVCNDAVELLQDVVYNGTTIGATGTDLSSCSYNDTADAWHFYEPNAGGQVTINTDGSSFDTTLSVFCACDGDELACNDDYSLDNTNSEVVIDVVKGKTYLIRVAGYNRQTGDYQLFVTRGVCAEPLKSDLNNDCKVDFMDFAVLVSEWLNCGLDNQSLCWE